MKFKLCCACTAAPGMVVAWTLVTQYKTITAVGRFATEHKTVSGTQMDFANVNSSNILLHERAQTVLLAGIPRKQAVNQYNVLCFPC